MTRIVGHVNYSKPSDKEVPAHGFVKSAERKKAKQLQYRDKIVPRRKATPALLLEWLRDLARNNQRAPTEDQMRTEFGNAGKAMLRSLVSDGTVTRIEIYGKNWRVIELDGLRTAPYIPKYGKGLPYRVIDKAGDHWLAHGR